MRLLLLFNVAILLFQCGSDGKRHHSFSFNRSKRQEFIPEDAVLTVEPLPPSEVVTSRCSCTCCDNNEAKGKIMHRKPFSVLFLVLYNRKYS